MIGHANPRVSVIIPVFNGEDKIAAAVDSALAQEFEGGFEVVVVDDGSTDSTREILRRYQSRITVMEEQRRGASAARNAAVETSRGEYLAFLDADDTWMPRKLARSVAALDAHPECVLVYHDQLEVDVNGILVNASMFPSGHPAPPTFDDLLSLEHVYFSIVSSAVVMRRSAFEACGGFNERLRSCHDTHLWILAREQGPFFYIDERLGTRRGGPSAAREQWYISGAPEFDRVLRDRYGARYRGDLHFVNLLTAAAKAMHRHDRALARKRYAEALRLLLTFAPFSIAIAADRVVHRMTPLGGASR
jgi:glycosyltransferase involved in cell wall biosynthesis